MRAAHTTIAAAMEEDSAQFFPAAEVPINEGIEWYQRVILECNADHRKRVVRRGSRRRWRHESLCIGLGTEVFGYEVSQYPIGG